MKKFLLLAMALFLVGCEKEVEPEVTDPEVVDPVVEEPTDEVAPLVTLKMDSTTIEEDVFDASEFVTVEDESAYSVVSDYSSSVDFEVAGDYVVTITVTDEYGNATAVELTVTVAEKIPEERIYLRATLPISDYSNDYNIEADTLNVYVDQEDIGITYVNAEEFIVALRGAVIPLEVEKTDVLRVFYTYEVDEEAAAEGEEDFTYEMVFNAAENTVAFNDVDFLDALDDETETDYSQGLEVVFSEISDTDFSHTFDLDDYNMNIELFEDGNYYMPLYLANFFLTGFGVEVYELDTELLLMDYRTYDESRGFFKEWEDRDAVDLTLVADDTYNWLALWFDTMYGLNENKGIEDIYALLDQYPALQDGSSRRQFYMAMNDLVNDLDDLHSSFYYAGYRMQSYDPTDNYYNEESKLRKYYDAYFEYKCDSVEPTVKLTVVNDVAFVKVNGYALDFPELFDPIMEEAANYDDIVFDLTCNGGGLVSSAISMLTYMTDDTVLLYETDPFTGALYTTGYVSEESNYVPANYYVFTSPVTFSAANLFTSAVKDNELGVIIGVSSSGGACAVQYALTPDGAVFSNSSNYAYSNQYGEVIEDGIAPDRELLEKFSGLTWYQTIAEIIETEY